MADMLMKWSDAIIMALGILLFGAIVWLTYRGDAHVRADQATAARLPFAMKDELDGPA